VSAVRLPMDGGIGPDRELLERSKKVSSPSVPMLGGISPERLLSLRSRWASRGKDTKSSPSNRPDRLHLGREMLDKTGTTAASSSSRQPRGTVMLQTTPVQLQGLVRLLHDLRQPDGLAESQLDFHRRRASASLSSCACATVVEFAQ
jgi:hypothetical protein